jgi:hypothetical protein
MREKQNVMRATCEQRPIWTTYAVSGANSNAITQNERDTYRQDNINMVNEKIIREWIGGIWI